MQELVYEFFQSEKNIDSQQLFSTQYAEFSNSSSVAAYFSKYSEKNGYLFISYCFFFIFCYYMLHFDSMESKSVSYLCPSSANKC